ncbi:cupin domain-containing protein [Archangium violaceum]|uniref:cupin domain-containing protein n=1 Tax=Archangium violaceum TaxID=83451 RepID=UPI002B29BC78|nr:cupin domain-containing protein [Archangium gephyra]
MFRHVHLNRMLVLGVVALAGLMTACGGELPQGDEAELASSEAALGGNSSRPKEMIVYPLKGKVCDDGFVNLGSPENLGGRVLEGNPKIYARIDYSKGPVAAGLFKATKGKIRITFPFTEHATILEGEVILTDEAGNTHKYKAGDSYFIRQGQVILWEVKGKEVIKSFFNTVEAP